jgi:hypothetical protein
VRGIIAISTAANKELYRSQEAPDALQRARAASYSGMTRSA